MAAPAAPAAPVPRVVSMHFSSVDELALVLEGQQPAGAVTLLLVERGFEVDSRSSGDPYAGSTLKSLLAGRLEAASASSESRRALCFASCAVIWVDMPVIGDAVLQVLRHLPALSEMALYFRHYSPLPAGDLVHAAMHAANLCLVRIHGRNALPMLPVSVCQLTALTTLDLYACNSLTALPDSIRQLTSLKTLDLQYCGSLTALPNSMGQLTALMTLDLHECSSLTALPDSMGQLSALCWLVLSDCRKISTPPRLQTVQPFEYLDFRNTRLPQPLQVEADAEVACVRLVAMSQAYHYQGGGVKPEEVQVLIVGRPGAGKTSLLRTLEAGRSMLTEGPDRSTRGVEVHRLPGIVPNATTRARFVDFAGQSDYLLSHQLFLSSQVCVLLVVDLEHHTAASFALDVQLWLDTLEARVGGDITVLLVGTHARGVSTEQERQQKCQDLVEKVRQAEQERLAKLRARLEQHPGDEQLQWACAHRPRLPACGAEVVLVDSAEPAVGFTSCFETLPSLADSLERMLSSIQLDPVPKSFLLLQQRLEPLRVPILTWSQLTKIVATDPILAPFKLGHVPGLLGAAVSFLHTTGHVRWYRDNPRLVNHVFLDMQWLSDAVRALVRHDLQAEPRPESLAYRPVEKGYSTQDSYEQAMFDLSRKALLQPALLHHLWAELPHAREHLGVLWVILQEMGVCFPPVSTAEALVVEPLLYAGNLGAEQQQHTDELRARWNSLSTRPGQFIFSRVCEFDTATADPMFLQRAVWGMMRSRVSSRYALQQRLYSERAMLVVLGAKAASPSESDVGFLLELDLGQTGQTSPRLSLSVCAHQRGDAAALLHEVFGLWVFGNAKNPCLPWVLQQYPGLIATQFYAQCPNCSAAVLEETSVQELLGTPNAHDECWKCQQQFRVVDVVPIEANPLLQQAQTTEVLDRLHDLQRSILRLPAQFAQKLDSPVPRFILVLPHRKTGEKMSWFQRVRKAPHDLTQEQLDIYVLCEHGLCNEAERAKCTLRKPYTIRVAREWVHKALPVLNALSVIAMIAIKLATGVQVSFEFMDQYKHLAEKIKLAAEGLEDIEDVIHKVETKLHELSHSTHAGASASDSQSMYRQLARVLESETSWPDDHAGLMHEFRDSSFKWVCGAHAAAGPSLDALGSRANYSELHRTVRPVPTAATGPRAKFCSICQDNAWFMKTCGFCTSHICSDCLQECIFPDKVKRVVCRLCADHALQSDVRRCGSCNQPGGLILDRLKACRSCGRLVCAQCLPKGPKNACARCI